MNFTEYKFETKLIENRISELSKNLAVNRGITDLLAFGLSLVVDRLRTDKMRYRDYGPYWWALKDVLNRNGYEIGNQSDPMIKEAYKGDSNLETVVMANEFRDVYLASNLVYTNKFMLDGETGEFWILFDSDMENVK